MVTVVAAAASAAVEIARAAEEIAATDGAVAGTRNNEDANQAPADITENPNNNADTAQADQATATATADGQDPPTNGGEEEEPEVWDLIAILGASQIRKADHSCTECSRTACSVWALKGADDEEPWYGCVECQDGWFGGFPEPSSGDLPINSITNTHRALIIDKCSDAGGEAARRATDVLAKLPTKAEPPAPPSAAADGAGGGAVTPPPGKGLVTAAAGAKSKKGGKGSSKSAKADTSGVTPSPVPPRGAAAAAATGGNTTTATVSKKAAAKAAKAKKSTLEPMLKKWQDAATSMGGGKIVVAKGEAKKIVFDMLSDAFRPMNITEIFNELKGVVPSSVLKGCLEDMADVDTANPFDADSDDEDDKLKKSKKKGGKKSTGDDVGADYAGSLVKKEGRNANNVLYFVDYSSPYVTNGGNGLPPDERNELIGAEQKSAQDLQAIRENLKSMQEQTKKLLSEPTNKEAEERIAKEEKVLADLKASLEESRQYAGNEKKREQTKKRIRNLADVWWKRRRQCNDFLQGMEDATEGTISVKKCLAGDGQIDIDSDEAVIAAEREMYEMRKAKKAKKKHSSDGCFPPTANFIGVQFTSAAKVERIYA